MTQVANEEAMMSLLPGLRDFTFEPQYWANKLDTIVRTPAVIKSLQRTKDSNVRIRPIYFIDLIALTPVRASTIQTRLRI
jgi:hypothetical protein